MHAGAENDLRRRLAELVAFDTQNPMGNERPLAQHAGPRAGALGARTVETFEAGGHHAVYARFGDDAPSLLVNAHIDTVPANSGYTRPAPPPGRARRAAPRPGRAPTPRAPSPPSSRRWPLQAAEGRPPRGVGGPVLGRRGERRNACIARLPGQRRAPAASSPGHRLRAHQLPRRAPPPRHRRRPRRWPPRRAGTPRAPTIVPNPLADPGPRGGGAGRLGPPQRELGPPGFRGLCLNVAAIDGGRGLQRHPHRAPPCACRCAPRPAPTSRELLAEAEGEARARGRAPRTWTGR